MKRIFYTQNRRGIRTYDTPLMLLPTTQWLQIVFCFVVTFDRNKIKTHWIVCYKLHILSSNHSIVIGILLETVRRHFTNSCEKNHLFYFLVKIILSLVESKHIEEPCTSKCQFWSSSYVCLGIVSISCMKNRIL